MKKAAIVGCGNIAGFLDTPEDESIFTHAHAYLKHQDTELIAICESSSAQTKKFLARWGTEIRAYSTLADLLDNETIDILSICTPTPFHAEVLNIALSDKNICHILCEKPFVQNQKELDELTPFLQNTKKKISINFIRRYDPSHQELQRLINNEELGKVLHFNGNFTKGLYHNGSHMLALIEHLCGEISLIKADSSSIVEDDLYGSFYIETSSTRGVIQNESGHNYALFEFEIICTEGRIKILNSGHTIEIETLQNSEQYPDYINLKYRNTLDDTFRHNLFNSLNYLLHATDTRSTFKDHLILSQKLLAIKEHLHKKHILEFT